MCVLCVFVCLGMCVRRITIFVMSIVFEVYTYLWDEEAILISIVTTFGVIVGK